MWPIAGVKLGRVDAVERSLVREVTAASWGSSLVMVDGLFFAAQAGTYHPTADNVSNGRRHIDIDSIHVVAAKWCYLVLHALSLAPALLPNDPDTTVFDLGPIVRRIVRNHVFKALHLPQPTLEGLACLDKVIHARLVESLYGYDGIV